MCWKLTPPDIFKKGHYILWTPFLAVCHLSIGFFWGVYTLFMSWIMWLLLWIYAFIQEPCGCLAAWHHYWKIFEAVCLLVLDIERVKKCSGFVERHGVLNQINALVRVCVDGHIGAGFPLCWSWEKGIMTFVCKCRYWGQGGLKGVGAQKWFLIWCLVLIAGVVNPYACHHRKYLPSSIGDALKLLLHNVIQCWW